MSGLSISHLAIILVVLVLLFGTSKLKNLGKDLGGAIKGFKESMQESELVPSHLPTSQPLMQHQPVQLIDKPLIHAQKIN